MSDRIKTHITDAITTGEAATILNEDIRTAIRKADAGLFGTVVLTPGGHRRVSRAAVVAHALEKRRRIIATLPRLEQLA